WCLRRGAARRLESGAAHDAKDKRRYPVVIPGRLPDDGAYRRHVRRTEATTERIRHQPLGKAQEQGVHVLQERLTKSLSTVYGRSVVQLAGRIDRDLVVFDSILPRYVEVLERQAKRIDHAMARRARRVATVLFHALAHRQQLAPGRRLRGLERRYVRR